MNINHNSRKDASIRRGNCGRAKEEFFRKKVAQEIKRLGDPYEVNSSEFEEYRFEKNPDKITFFRILDDALSDLGYLRISHNIYRKL